MTKEALTSPFQMLTNSGLLHRKPMSKRQMLRRRQQASLSMLLTWTNGPDLLPTFGKRGDAYMRTRSGAAGRSKHSPRTLIRQPGLLTPTRGDTLLAIATNAYIYVCVCIFICVCICLYNEIQPYLLPFPHPHVSLAFSTSLSFSFSPTKCS